MPDLPLPVTYREEIFEEVKSLLKAGESCALIGVGSSGKSNIARHLLRADVRLHHFGASAAQIALLYINCKPFAHREPHELYLHTLDQLSQALAELNGSFTPLLSEVETLWREAQAAPTSLAKRSLNLAIAGAVRSGAERVIVMLDDCDDLFHTAPPVLFSDLRELRDNYKVRLVYVTLTRREPAFLRPDAKEYEELFELFSTSRHNIPIPPYREADAFHMIRRLAARPDPPRNLSDAEIRLLFDLSGGHAGLIRALYFVTQEKPGLFARDKSDDLAAQAAIDDECNKIMDSLEEDEKIALYHIARCESPQADVLRRLRRRGLIHPGIDGVFSPVFDAFLRGQGESARSPVHIEFTGNGWQVRVSGELIDNLTWPEFEVLQALCQKRGQVCTYEELLDAVRVPERATEEDRVMGKPLERLNRYVQRLRARLGPAAARCIVTEKDGYRFV